MRQEGWQRGPPKARLGDETSSEDELSNLISFPWFLSIPLPMVWTFHSIIQITGHLTTYPSTKEERLGSRVAKTAFFFPFLKPIFHQRRVGSIGSASDSGALPAWDVNIGGLAFCIFSVFTRVFFM